MEAKPRELWYAAAALLAVGLFLRIMGFDPEVSWDAPLSYALLGLGFAIALLAAWRTGLRGFGRAVRAHPVAVTVLVVFLLISVIAVIAGPPPEAE